MAVYEDYHALRGIENYSHQQQTARLTQKIATKILIT